MNPRTIMVIPDTPPKRTAYEEQVIRTFYLSHADAAELVQTVQQILQLPGLPVQPRVLANKTQNSLTVRASDRVMNIIDQVIRNNDKPRAEIVVDVEIIEVNRVRAKEVGLNLSQYAVGAIFSPEQPPNTGEGGQPPFNLNTITRGISAADFYLTVPQAVVNFLATDNNNKIIAKPQLRGTEGQVITLDLGDEIPVPSTTFGGLGGGGLTTIPINQFNYRTVGIKMKLNKPRVTLEGEILTELEVESSNLGANIDIAGQSLPTFGTRRVTSFIRMREGESLMLAGLLREDQRRALTGFPGLLHTPILRRIFGNTVDQIQQTDIVFLMTPRLVRSSEVTQENLDPIYIGSQQNLGSDRRAAADRHRSGRGGARRRSRAAGCGTRGARGGDTAGAAVEHAAGAAADRPGHRAAGRPARRPVAASRRPPASRWSRSRRTRTRSRLRRHRPRRRRHHHRHPAPAPSATARLAVTTPGPRVRRRWRSVHGADHHRRRPAPVDGQPVDHLQPVGVAGAIGAAGHVPRAGRGDADVHAPDRSRCRPRRPDGAASG